MTDPPDVPGTDDSDPAWPADSFDRWLAALDITDTDPDIDADDPGSERRDPPIGTEGAGLTDPWADVDLEPVDLSSDQRAYLLWHEHQPPVARLRGIEDDPSDD